VLDAILFFGSAFVIFVWVPVLGFAILRRLRGREPLWRGSPEGDDEAADPQNASKRSRLFVSLSWILAAPLIAVGLAAIAFMFVIFGPPTMLADWIWRLRAKEGPGRPPKGANEP